MLDLPAGTRVRAIGVESHSLTTLAREVVIGDDDVAHAAVVERHHASGRIGRGHVTGFGLRRGAIASTVAHDAHNLVVLGASAAPTWRSPSPGWPSSAAARWPCSTGASSRRSPLPLAGLMSDMPAE